jgi:hypothetical protein
MSNNSAMSHPCPIHVPPMSFALSTSTTIYFLSRPALRCFWLLLSVPSCLTLLLAAPYPSCLIHVLCMSHPMSHPCPIHVPPMSFAASGCFFLSHPRPVHAASGCFFLSHSVHAVSDSRPIRFSVPVLFPALRSLCRTCRQQLWQVAPGHHVGASATSMT